MTKEFKIASRLIGPDIPPLIIAEIGINHNGCLATAKEMVLSAKRAGAELIKHQTHVIEDEMSHHAKAAIPGNANKSIYDIMASCALNRDDELELMKFVQDQGMIFISTPFSRAALHRLEEFNVEAYKIGSGECNNYPLLELVAALRKPTIMSTGMNTIESVEKAVAIFTKHQCPLALLHCVNIYPTPPENLNLQRIKILQEKFPELNVGYSDHSSTEYPVIAAIALGATIIERHYTDHMQRIGPDIACSMDEDQMSRIIKAAEIIHAGNREITRFSDEEKTTMNFAFASVVTTRAIKTGEVFTEENIWVKRPATGYFNAEKYQSIIGKTCLTDIGPDHQLRKSDVTC